MDRLKQDAKLALRRLQARPSFAIVAILTLALGIGATSAIFSVLRAVLLRPLPYEDPERVVMVWNSWTGWRETWLSDPEVFDYRAGVQGFEQLAAYTTTSANLTGGGEPERLAVATVTPEIFDVLGVKPVVGRGFLPEEGRSGGQRESNLSGNTVAVIGYGLWQRRFGGDRSIVGSTILVNGSPRTVVGILPAGLRLPKDYEVSVPAEVWLPLVFNPDSLGSRGSHYLFGVARLREGATIAQANAELRRVTQRWVQDGVVHAEAQFTAYARPVSDVVLGSVRPVLLVLVGAVVFVLLIACANVANLLLARSDDRGREMAIRASLGATRRRLFEQLLTESILLATAGGVAGVLLARLGLQVLLALDPASVPRVEDVRLDSAVLAFTAILTVLTGILFGLAPALKLSRPGVRAGSMADMLRDGGRTTAGQARQRFRRVLVVAEIALSVVLVVGAGLMIRSFLALQRIDLGYDPASVLTLRMALPARDYSEPQQVVTFYRELQRRVKALPGVRSAGFVRLLPLTGTMGDWSISIEGRTRAPNENPHGDWQVVTPGYFETMGMQLVRGRFLQPGDHENGMPAVVINETMAREYWPNEDAIGKRFRQGTMDQPFFTIVGIVRDTRHNAVVEEARTEMYHPHAQYPMSVGFAPQAMTLVVKTAGAPLRLVDAVRSEVRALDANVPVSEVQAMEHVVANAFSQPRFTTFLLVVFAGIALSLAAIGVYGVFSYAVTQRTHELGIRVALGARWSDILGLVLGGGAALALAGIALGTGAALLLTRLMRTLLYGVGTLDPLTFVLVPLLLAVVALLACYIPARRATKLDPLTALRQE
jgi:putative ABC transport system permease protein